MYHTPTTAIVAVGTVTPVVGVVASQSGPDTAAPLAAPVVDTVVQGPGIVEVLGSQETIPDVAGASGGEEVVEVLGVKITQEASDNPLVDAIQGVANGTLPFTGLNILFLTLTAITVVLIGLTMIRIARNLATPAG